MRQFLATLPQMEWYSTIATCETDWCFNGAFPPPRWRFVCQYIVCVLPRWTCCHSQSTLVALASLVQVSHTFHGRSSLANLLVDCTSLSLGGTIFILSVNLLGSSPDLGHILVPHYSIRAWLWGIFLTLRKIQNTSFFCMWLTSQSGGTHISLYIFKICGETVSVIYEYITRVIWITQKRVSMTLQGHVVQLGIFHSISDRVSMYNSTQCSRHVAPKKLHVALQRYSLHVDTRTECKTRQRSYTRLHQNLSSLLQLTISRSHNLLLL
jgi:hypothetical protein